MNGKNFYVEVARTARNRKRAILEFVGGALVLAFWTAITAYTFWGLLGEQYP